MRAVELGKVAASAEALRVKRLARRQAMRAAYGVGALVFGVAVFVLLHVLAYDGLVALVRPWLAVLIILAVDLVIAGILGILAVNSTPGRIEREALAVRTQALAEAKRSLTVMTIVGELTGFAIGQAAYRTTGRSGSRVGMLIDIASRVARRR